MKIRFIILSVLGLFICALSSSCGSSKQKLSYEEELARLHNSGIFIETWMDSTYQLPSYIGILPSDPRNADHLTLADRIPVYLANYLDYGFELAGRAQIERTRDVFAPLVGTFGPNNLKLHVIVDLWGWNNLKALSNLMGLDAVLLCSWRVQGGMMSPRENVIDVSLIHLESGKTIGWTRCRYSHPGRDLYATRWVATSLGHELTSKLSRKDRY